MDILGWLLGGIRIVLGFLLVLFIPGLLLSLAFFPRQSDLSSIERLVYATTMSIGTAMLSILVMDGVLGLDMTPENIVLALIAVSILFALLWGIRKLLLTAYATERVSKITGKFSLKNFRNIQGILKRFGNP